ncbi:Crp/Fnr family transcriptional regulator [Runella sp. MFBS21]|uniref:Crp/Fnr family transcriptional regulator n=1 Tax=Runella sp. MFBS21 TaxID=3034018 RepID=UPI0023F93561|nr:Crp/Fnr family transcriptional regulator [Runella sp. MFBS21]MDF7821068.1 Crp/Fnr family transcriptional regulator [Runella sp. MFBS21]
MQSEIALFLDSVKVICPDISDEELSRFASKLTTIELNKKEFFIHSDKIQKSIGFITKGVVRAYFVDAEGDERTVGFYAEGDYATHYPAFITQTPSRYSIQCLEPTTLVCLSFENQQLLYQQSPVFERYGRIIAEEVLKAQQSRIESFIFETAEERYLHFMKRNAALFNRVSLSHLCSYLGIERQSLTRIRQKLAHK